MKKISLIAAVSENMGIGFKGDLPWRLKKESEFFGRTTKKVADSSKKNACIMGRKTYFGIPEKYRPLEDRLNIILTSNPSTAQYPPGVITCKNLEESLNLLDSSEYKDAIESIWIVGGSGVYKEAMESDRCHRLYITRVKSNFECDAFFPTIDENLFKLVQNDSDIPTEVQTENGIDYVYTIYEKIH